MGEVDRRVSGETEWVIAGRDWNADASHPFRRGAMRRATFPIKGKDPPKPPYFPPLSSIDRFQ